MLNDAINKSDVQYYSAEIDATVAAVSTLFTSLSSASAGNFFPELIFVVLTEQTGFVAATLNVTVGTNNPLYDNFVGSVIGLTNVGDYQIFNTTGSTFPSLPPATDFKINIISGQTATTAHIKVLVVGYYL